MRHPSLVLLFSHGFSLTFGRGIMPGLHLSWAQALLTGMNTVQFAVNLFIQLLPFFFTFSCQTDSPLLQLILFLSDKGRWHPMAVQEERNCCNQDHKKAKKKGCRDGRSQEVRITRSTEIERLIKGFRSVMIFSFSCWLCTQRVHREGQYQYSKWARVIASIHAISFEAALLTVMQLF